MMAAKLYKETLVGFEACLVKGASASLSEYCKIHHVNYQGLINWMKGHPTNPIKNASKKVASQPECLLGHMIPLLIQPPLAEGPKELAQSKSPLMGVKVTTQTGLIVCIPEISCVDLVGLILSCNIR